MNETFRILSNQLYELFISVKSPRDFGRLLNSSTIQENVISFDNEVFSICIIDNIMCCTKHMNYEA